MFDFFNIRNGPHNFFFYSEFMELCVSLCVFVAVLSFSHVQLFVTLWLQHTRLPCPSFTVCLVKFILRKWRKYYWRNTAGFSSHKTKNLTFKLFETVVFKM